MRHLSLMNLFCLLMIWNSNCQNPIRNSTECYLMYLNKTTTIECITNTTCCLLIYEFKGSEKIICILKENPNDNYCSDFKDTIGLYGGDLQECNCQGNHLFFSIFNIMLLIYFVELTIII